MHNYLYPYSKSNLKAVKECPISYKEEIYPLSNHTVIYCKDVSIFRNNKKNWYTKLDEVTECDIILTPSISLREKETSILKEDLKYKDENGYLNIKGKEIKTL